MNGTARNKKENPSSFQFSAYLLALRPWSFSASFTPVLLGAFLCWRTTGQLDFSVTLFSLISVLGVHAAGNVVNTYYDYMQGVDSNISDDRTLVDHILSPQQVVRLGVISYVIASISLLILVALSPAKMEHLALIFFGGLSGSFIYTGGIGLKYFALGDIVILVLFGPVAVLFSFFAQCGNFAWFPLVYAIPLALNTEAILHSNNTRDMAADKKAGAVTLAILLGEKMSFVLYCLLLFTPYVICVVFVVNFSFRFLLPVLTLGIAFGLEKEFRVGNLFLLPKKTAKLNLMFGLLYVVSIAISEKLPHLGKNN